MSPAPNSPSDPSGSASSRRHPSRYGPRPPAGPGSPPGSPPGPAPASSLPPDSPEEWEGVRRSVAMLQPGAWALKREQALAALGLLVTLLRRAREQTL